MRLQSLNAQRRWKTRRTPVGRMWFGRRVIPGLGVKRAQEYEPLSYEFNMLFGFLPLIPDAPAQSIGDFHGFFNICNHNRACWIMISALSFFGPAFCTATKFPSIIWANFSEGVKRRRAISFVFHCASISAAQGCFCRGVGSRRRPAGPGNHYQYHLAEKNHLFRRRKIRFPARFFITCGIVLVP